MRGIVGQQLLQAGLCLAGLFGGGFVVTFAAMMLIEAISPGATHDQGGLSVTMCFGPSGMLAGGWAGFRLGGWLAHRRD